jgi:hypothetical protein
MGSASSTYRISASVLVMRYINRTTGVGEVAGAQGGVGELPATIRLRGHAATYHVRVGRTIDGPVLLGLRIDPDPGYEITGADLKQIPAQRLAAAALPLGVNPDDDFEPEIHFTVVDFENFATPESAGSGTRPAKTTVGHPFVHGRDHYVEVAKLAVQARAGRIPARDGGLSARAAIAKKWNVTPQTADRWMRTARNEYDLLPRSKRAPGTTKGTETR